jgi:cryptochrome
MSKPNSIYWFRKALRCHDNPALNYALENSNLIYPVFILDPWFVENARVGANRWRFLLESLQDLNERLKKKNLRLLVIQGNPIQVLKEKFEEWKIGLLCFESDTEPYAKKRDAEVRVLAKANGITVETKWSHTLYDPSILYMKNGNKVRYILITGILLKLASKN